MSELCELGKLTLDWQRACITRDEAKKKRDKLLDELTEAEDYEQWAADRSGWSFIDFFLYEGSRPRQKKLKPVHEDYISKAAKVAAARRKVNKFSKRILEEGEA